MTIKHLYFHSSKLDYIECFARDSRFEYVGDYPPIDANLALQSEWGRIKTNSFHYHFILGNLQFQDKGCPWCGDKCNLVINPINEVSHTTCWMECPTCLSRGPLLRTMPIEGRDTREFGVVSDIIRSIFNLRIQWDHDLINPYEKEKNEPMA